MFTQEEWENAPVCDDTGLFIHFEQLARAKVETARDRAEDYNEDGWSSTVDALKRQYLTTVFALAEKLNIQLRSAYGLDSLFQHQNDNLIYSEVCVRVDAIIVHYNIGNHLDNKKPYIKISTTSKEKIRKLVGQIKKVVDSSEIDVRKKNRLLSKLSSFEKEVESQQITYHGFMEIVVDTGAALGKFAKNAEPLTNQICRLLGREREAQEVKRLGLGYEPQKLLEGPTAPDGGEISEDDL